MVHQPERGISVFVRPPGHVYAHHSRSDGVEQAGCNDRIQGVYGIHGPAVRCSAQRCRPGEEFRVPQGNSPRCCPCSDSGSIDPVCPDDPGRGLVVQLQNVAGEPYRGTLRVGDSVARDSRMSLTLLRSMGVVRDTLPLKWADGVPDGDYVIQVHVGKGRRPVGSLPRANLPPLPTRPTPSVFTPGSPGVPWRTA